MADFATDPVAAEVLDGDHAYVAWVSFEIPGQAYIEYRDTRPVGQLWPRGGLPEGAETGPQPA